MKQIEWMGFNGTGIPHYVVPKLAGRGMAKFRDKAGRHRLNTNWVRRPRHDPARLLSL